MASITREFSKHVLNIFSSIYFLQLYVFTFQQMQCAKFLNMIWETICLDYDIKQNVFSDCGDLKQEASGMQTPAAKSRYKAGELMSPCQLNFFLAGEASRTCSGESAVAPLGARSEEDCASEVKFPNEMVQKERDVNSTMESEDLAACVVEDSEDETDQVESIRRTRHCLLNWQLWIHSMSKKIGLPFLVFFL